MVGTNKSIWLITEFQTTSEPKHSEVLALALAILPLGALAALALLTPALLPTRCALATRLVGHRGLARLSAGAQPVLGKWNILHCYDRPLF